ncbi:glycosyltransferase family 4 protein [Serratia liquefaciens]|uniref:glycosyltransferase family 4 protein n=1 Tax=Serratia liquefaciens TaxID=614 RepID=UPI002177028C|nr:glycosyltransferase family 4 protein [Serratia liquefaciens]CAI2037524.1 UDP-D-galactose:(glucosyl)lipopolysaccharide-1,6-D-galactosyltransferase [Serratia liquefaciens]
MNDSLDDLANKDIDRFIKDTEGKSISFIFPSKFLGGHEIMTIEIIKSILSRNEIDSRRITCFLPEENIKTIEILRQNAIGFETFRSKFFKPEFLHAFFNPFYILRCLNIFSRIQKNSKVILVQGDILQGVGFILVSKWLSRTLTSYIPYAHSFQKMGAKSAKLKDFFSKIVYKTCNSYITISECFKHEIEIKNKTADVSLIHNFVTKPAERIVLRELTFDSVINIFIVGRVQFHQKGHNILVNALAGIKAYKIVLHIVGDGPDLHNLRMMEDQLPSNVSLIFYGWASDSWGIARDKNIDLLVIPSFFEGVPLVMLEAMERNVPIIAAARDGMLDYLPVESLYEVTGDNVAALRDKIIHHIQKRLAEI